MGQEFEGMDLAESVFWGVDLKGTRFRDVDLSNVVIEHARLVDVEIDALVERVVINGVDVTDYVNERDEWYPLRAMLLPADPEAAQRAWTALEQAWDATIRRARGLTDAQLRERVGGEWSFVETLRHLVFAIDKWFTLPLAGGSFSVIGVPNTGSKDFGWPGLDVDADPSLDDVLTVRADRARQFRTYLDSLSVTDLDREVEVLENGRASVRECIYTVLEEEFEHHRYATRDLASLESP
jgi:hypothetical protein